MTMRPSPRRLAVIAAAVLALATPLLARAQNASAAEALTVNLASVTGTATSVGEGFLYGISQDATQPPDQFLLPLGITALRGGGHASGGGWIGDGYTYGTSTKADVAEVIAKRSAFPRPGYHAQYQVILADLYGADGSQPSNTTYPCAGGNCSNWTTFIDDVAGAIKAFRGHVAYDVWNEPDESIFWAPGMNTTQYFNMWDTGVKEIEKHRPGRDHRRAVACRRPSAEPERVDDLARPCQVGRDRCPPRSADHLEGDGDDPVAVAQVHRQRPVGRRHLRHPADGQRVAAAESADRRPVRLVPGPIRPVRVRQRGARQLGTAA